MSYHKRLMYQILYTTIVFILFVFIPGELIGVQCLFQQTGQALQDMNPDAEETAELIEELNVAR